MSLETFRTSKYVQRNELIRFQLDDVIQIPAVSTKRKMDISLRLMTDLQSTIGIMLISRCNSSCKN